MAKLPKEVMDAMVERTTMKMLATVNGAGVPNVVVMGSTAAIDEETLAFADMKMIKTKANLNETKKFAVSVIKSPTEAWQIKGTFDMFQETGPLVDMFNELIYQKTRMQIKGVGVGKVDEVYLTPLLSACTKLV